MIGELLQLQVLGTHQSQVILHHQVLAATAGGVQQVLAVMIGEVPGLLEHLTQAKTTGKRPNKERH